MFTQEFIEHVKSSIDLVELAGRYTNLKREGNGYIGLCPKHQDANPSFHIKIENGRQSWCCFGCHNGKKSTDPNDKHYNYGTDVIAFYAWMYDIKNFKTALTQLCNLYGIPIPDSEVDNYYKKMDEICSCYESNWAAGSKKYLYDRGLTNQDIKDFRLGYQGNKIIFPLIDAYGHVVGFVKRWIEIPEGRSDKYRMMQNNEYFAKRSYLYNINNLDTSFNEIRLTEGPMDALMATKYGVRNVVALLGREVFGEQIIYFKKKGLYPVFILDGDESGLESIDKYIKAFAKEGIYSKAVILPDDMDLCDFSRLHKEDTERYIENNAITYAQYMMKPIIDKYDSVTSNFMVENYRSIKDIYDKIPTEDEKAYIRSTVYKKFGLLL